MFVLKNRHAPELTEANSHARLSHSKQLLKNIHSVMLASFCSLTQTHLRWPHRKADTMSDCTNIYQPRRKLSWENNKRSVTDNISRWGTSGWHYTRPVW